MDTTDETLREWYEGELGGEARFDLLAERTESERVKWRRLGEVERRTLAGRGGESLRALEDYLNTDHRPLEMQSP